MSFADILNTKASDLPVPPILPAGSYTATVVKAPEFQDNDNWDIINVLLRPIEAGDDVDEELLADYGSLKNAIVRHSFIAEKGDETAALKTVNAFKRFLLEHLEVEAEDDDTLADLMNKSVNHRCVIVVEHRARKDSPDQLDLRVKMTLPVED